MQPDNLVILWEYNYLCSKTAKTMHGQYPARVNKPDVDQEKTHLWLRSSGLKSESEGLIVVALDQSLATKSYHHKIVNDGTDLKCRCMENLRRQ